MKRTIKYLVPSIALFALILGLAYTVNAQTPAPANATFPLAKGATWTYEAQVQYDNNGKTEEKTLPWVVTVKEVIERAGVRVYVMNGSLNDLAFYTPTTKPSDYLLVEIVPNRFYTADIDALKKFQDPNDPLAGIVSDENVVLDLPLVTDKRFCAANYITRSDGMFCWVVGDETIANVQAQGVPANAHVIYPLTYKTNADNTTEMFAPGLGITQYQYQHFGTPAQVDAKLTAYKAGTPATSATTPATTYTDPFAYCAAVGNVDAPNAQWAGPALPDSVLNGLVKAAGISPDMPKEVLEQGSFWRCMNKQVYACTVGANLPCQEKADLSKTPSAAMNEFCTANPNADVIPAVVTGRATVYEWKCASGKPEAGKQIFTADAQGFISEFWYAISK